MLFFLFVNDEPVCEPEYASTSGILNLEARHWKTELSIFQS